MAQSFRAKTVRKDVTSLAEMAVEGILTALAPRHARGSPRAPLSSMHGRHFVASLDFTGRAVGLFGDLRLLGGCGP